MASPGGVVIPGRGAILHQPGRIYRHTHRMSSMISTCRQTLLAALDQHPTVNIRESLAKSLGGTATKSEVAVAQRAARAIAEEGRAVLMTLYNHQPRASSVGHGNRAPSST